MKLTATRRLSAVIFAVLLSSFVSSLDFQLISPIQANENESFEVSIIANTSDTYDVKIFVTNDSKEFSEIYDGSAWKSTYYYLKSVFPQTSNFQMKAHSVGDTVVCSRLRKSGASSYTEVCNNVKINQVIQAESQSSTSNSSSSTSNQTASTGSSTANSSQNNSIISNSSNTKSNAQEQKSQTNSQAESSEKSSDSKIVLNSQAIKESSSAFTTGDGKIGIWITYSFTMLCVVIIIFLILKKL